jgi:co-chaperonin GroES (HSP10)
VYSTDQIRPQPGWALCRTLKPVTATKSGLFVAAGDLETGKTTEAVAEVLRVVPAVGEGGRDIDPGFQAGDKILIRDFLKFANQVGDLVGADRNDRVFLLNSKDVLAVVSGTGTLGYYGEYHLE